MFKLRSGQLINPKLVTSVTLKEIPKPKKFYFAICMAGNQYLPSEYFENIYDARAWLKTLTELIDG